MILFLLSLCYFFCWMLFLYLKKQKTNLLCQQRKQQRLKTQEFSLAISGDLPDWSPPTDDSLIHTFFRFLHLPPLCSDVGANVLQFTYGGSGSGDMTLIYNLRNFYDIHRRKKIVVKYLCQYFIPDVAKKIADFVKFFAWISDCWMTLVSDF